MSSAAMAGTEMSQELAAQTAYEGGAGWASLSGVGGESVAGSVALTGENRMDRYGGFRHWVEH